MKKILYFTFLLFTSHFIYAQDTTEVKTWYSERYDIDVNVIEANGKLGIMNDTGLVLLPLVYNSIEWFGENDSCNRWEKTLIIRQGKRHALADEMGKPITPLDYEEIQFPKAACESPHPATNVLVVRKDGKYGLIDAKGGSIIRESYAEVSFITDKNDQLFNPELVRVKKGNLYGFMALRSRQVVKSEYEDIQFLQNLRLDGKNYTLLKVKQKGKYGIYNLHDKTKIVYHFDEIYPFSTEEKLAMVKTKGKYGFIDLKSKVKIPAIYYKATSFRQGISIVKKGHHYGAIGANKKTVISFSYQEMNFMVSEEDENTYFQKFIKVKKGNLYGVVDVEGKEIVPIEYSSLELDKKKFAFKVTKNGKQDWVKFSGM